MNTSTLKNKIIEALNDSIELETKKEIFLCFRTHLSIVLKDYPTTKPLEWRMLQSQKRRTSHYKLWQLLHCSNAQRHRDIEHLSWIQNCSKTIRQNR